MKHYREQTVKPEEDFKLNRGSCKINGWEIAPTNHSEIRFDTRGTSEITSSDWKEFFVRVIRKTIGMRKIENGKKVPIKIESRWKSKDGDEILMWSKTLHQAIIYTVAPDKRIRIITILPWDKKRPNDENTVEDYVESISFKSVLNSSFYSKLVNSSRSMDNIIFEEID